MNNNQEYNAIHIGDGNYFDKVRLDIHESHKTIDSFPRVPKKNSRSFLSNKIRYLINGFMMKFKLQERLIHNGIRMKWFNEFYDYWINIINGRPLTLIDFFMLLHDYRKGVQRVDTLQWDNPEVHVDNWQNPNQIYSIFNNARRNALNPINGHQLWKRVKKNSHILEYGCSLAPYYNCYRQFFSHLNCKWHLADIPNFPFHYAKYLYRNDACVNFSTIYPTDFKNPLFNFSGFDVIILTTVLEHLDDPIFVTDYLLKRLKPGGLFVFDYVVSDGVELDTPASLEMRKECLKILLSRMVIIFGEVNIEKDVGFCIGKLL